MAECTCAFDVPPMTVVGSCVAWETELPHLLPLDFECVLGFAPISNVDRRLLYLHLHATYLSQGEEGSAPHPHFSPIL